MNLFAYMKLSIFMAVFFSGCDRRPDFVDITTKSQVKEAEILLRESVDLKGKPANESNVSILNIEIVGKENTDFRYIVKKNESCRLDDIESWRRGTTIKDSLSGDGEYTLCVYGTSKKGTKEISTDLISYSWKLDTVPPLARLSNLPSSLTNKKDLNAVVGGEGVVQYTYRVINQEQLCKDIEFDENWYEVSQPINGVEEIYRDGFYRLCVLGKDFAGNIQLINKATSHSWEVDTVPPRPPKAPSSRNFKVPFDFKLESDEVGNYFFRYTFSGRAPSDCGSGIFGMPLSVIEIPVATTSFNAVVCDAAGNMSDVTYAEYRYDIEPPSPPPSETIRFSSAWKFIMAGGNEEDFKDFRYTFSPIGPDSCSDGIIALPENPIIINETLTMRVIACDHLGNFSKPSVVTFIHDIEPPAVPLIPEDKAFMKSFTFTIGGGDEEDFKDFRYSMEGKNLESCDEGLSAQPDTKIVIPEVTTLLSAISCDFAGNVSPLVVRTYTFDSDALGSPSAPADHRFNKPFNIALSGGEGNDFLEFRYTLNDVAPVNCHDGIIALPGTEILIPGVTTVLIAISCDKAGNPSTSMKRTYTWDIEAPSLPVATESRVFVDPFEVVLAGGEEVDFKEFRYTITGQDLASCADGTSLKLNGAIAIPAETTILKAISCDTTGNMSLIMTKTYTYDSTAPKPPIAPESHDFKENFTITLIGGSEPDFKDFRYTITGIAPINCSDGESIQANVEIDISGATTTLNAVSCDELGNMSSVMKSIYTFDQEAPGTPILEDNKFFRTSFTLKIMGGSETDFKDFRYRLNGTPPANCTDGISAQPNDFITIPKATTQVHAISCDQLGNQSEAVSRTYTLDIIPPSKPGAEADKDFNQSFNLVLEGGNEADFKEFRYFLDGSTPSCNSGLVSTKGSLISIPASTTNLVAVACDHVGNMSEILVRKYTYDKVAPSMPTALANKKFLNSFQIFLSGGGESDFKEFRYSISGQNLSICSGGSPAQDNTPINILAGSTVTLRAISCDQLGNPSNPMERIYTYDNTPPSSPGATHPDQVFSQSFTVKLTGGSESDFLEFRYTLNGSTPDCAGGLIAQTNTEITIPNYSLTLRAIACDDLGNSSAPLVRIYSYDNTPPAAPGAQDSMAYKDSFYILLTGGTEADFKEFRYSLNGVVPENCTSESKALPDTGILISDGTRELRAISCDNVGNASSATSRTYTQDFTSPAAPTAPSDYIFYNSFSLKLGGGTETDFKEFRYTLDGSPPADCHAGTPAQSSDNILIPAETTVLKAISCDWVGNASPSISRTYHYGVYYKQITIPKTKVFEENGLSNFPMLVSLIDTDLHNNSQENGCDIAFYQGPTNSLQLLDFEIESFNKNYSGTEAQLIAWIKIPLLSASSDTQILMFYKLDCASSYQNPTGVWSNGYKMVWHLHGSTNAADSTINGNSGSLQGSPAIISGKIGTSLSLNGSDQHVIGPSASQLGVFGDSTRTFSIWANIQHYGSTLKGDIFGIGKIPDPDDTQYNSFNLMRDGNAVIFSVGGTTSWDIYTEGEGLDNWHYYVAVYNGSSLKLYADGDKIDIPISNLNTINNDLFKLRFNANEPIGGLRDEMRISNKERTMGWIKTEYANQNDPINFYLVGTQTESVTPNP